MPVAKARATSILGELERAHVELVGKAVVLTDGKAGTVESICLDEMHGLRNLHPRPRWKMARLNYQARAAGRGGYEIVGQAISRSPSARLPH